MTTSFVHADAETLGSYVSAGDARLVYLDPPFSVGVPFRARGEDGTRRRGPIAYVDSWRSIDDYLSWLEPRLAAAWQAVAVDGSLWLHLDHRAVHDAKVHAVRMFGPRCFQAEIIWVPGNGTKSRKGPGVTHQTILVFSKSKDFVWNADDPELREPYADTSLAMHFTHVDADGRRYRERVIDGKAYRYHADRGRAIGSVWTDCPAMHSNTPLRKETTGYPTQKPEKLLGRIVRGASLPGDLVVDPFMGSGTTLVAAAKAGRRAFGCDVGALSLETVRARLSRDALDHCEITPTDSTTRRER